MQISTSLTGLEARLNDTLPAGTVSTDVAAYAIDGVFPGLVVTPTTQEQIADIMSAAFEAGAAVVPWGAGAHQGLGSAPTRFDVALDLRGLNRIIEYEAANLTVTLEAGVLISDLQATLAAEGQWLPLDPPGPDGTIGGVLAANRSGPARMAHGAARDMTIGLNVVIAEGQAIKSGGRVVKNVAGYDLAKLHIGAIGSLGILVSASFKIAPLPVRSETQVLSAPSSQVLMSTSLQIRNMGLAVNGLTLFGSSTGYRLAVRFAGGIAAVERSKREVAAIAASNGVAIGPDAPIEPTGAVEAKISLSPTAVVEICDALVASGGEVSAYPTVGTVRAAWQQAPAPEVIERLRQRCRGLGGALVLEVAPADLKQRVGPWGEPGGDFALMRELKQQFDPNGTISPGRYVGGL